MRPAALLLAALAGAGCASPLPPPPQPAPLARQGLLTGTVTYRERLALPASATLTVLVWDALAQLPAAKVGETTLQIPGQVPIPFEVFFDPALIQQDHTYAARATLRVDGVVWFESTTPVPVITQGMPVTGVQILVARVPPPP
jgi:putative lipoprotein